MKTLHPVGAFFLTPASVTNAPNNATGQNPHLSRINIGHSEFTPQRPDNAPTTSQGRGSLCATPQRPDTIYRVGAWGVSMGIGNEY